MVDTINPQTGQPDSQGQNLSNNQASSLGQQPLNNTYYSGFDKPDEVRVNLVKAPEEIQSSNFPSGQEQQRVDAIATSQIPPTPSVTEGFMPQAEVVVSSANNRGMIVLVASGIFGVVLISLLTFFFSSNYYKGQLNAQEENVALKKQELENLKIVPDPLTLPVVEKAPESNSEAKTEETNNAVETPIETPIETPAPSSPSTNNSGQG